MVERVTHLEDCVARNSKLIGEVVDKLDVMMERQMADRVTLDKQTKILENGLSQKIARAINEFQREERERVIEAQRQALEDDRAERRLQIEEQKIHSAAIGQRKDRINRLLIAGVAVLTPIITIVLSKVFGG